MAIPEPVKGANQAGIKRDSGFKPADRLIVPLAITTGVGEVSRGKTRFRHYRDHTLKGRNGLAIIAAGNEALSEVAEGRLTGGIYGDGSLACLDGIVKPVELLQHDTEIGIYPRRFRHEIAGALEMIECFVEPSLAAKEIP